MADEAVIYEARMTLTTDGNLSISVDAVTSQDLRDSFKGEQSDWLDRMIKSHDVFSQYVDDAVDNFNRAMDERN